MASGIPIPEDDDLFNNANKLIRKLGEDVSLIKCACHSGNATGKETHVM